MRPVAGAVAASLLVLLAAARGYAAPGSFADVPAGHWAAPAIYGLRDLGVVSGDSSTFRPDDHVTRAELTKLVVLSRGWQPVPDCAGWFADAPPSTWQCPYVELGYRMALSPPLDPDRRRFGAGAAVDREELFAVVMRALGKRGEAVRMTWHEAWDRLRFRDRADFSDYARPYVALAQEAGLAHGYGDGRFRPMAPATRAEAAALVHTALVPRLLNPTRVGQADGHKVHYRTAVELLATAYGAGEPYLSDRTSLGISVREGIVAVDPTVIPLGTHLYVEGYGYAVAADTGRLIRGGRIDLWFDLDYNRLLDFGVQRRRVYFLD